MPNIEYLISDASSEDSDVPGETNTPVKANAPGESIVPGKRDMPGEGISLNKGAASSADVVCGGGIAFDGGLSLGAGIAPNEGFASDSDVSPGGGVAPGTDVAPGGGCSAGRDAALDANACCEDQERLLRAFTRASNELDELYRMMAKELGLSLSAYDILVVLRDNDGCHQKDLCDACYLTKQTVSSSVRAMERDGLVRVEPGGGRQTRIVLTDEGRALVDDRLSMVYAAEKRAFSRMSASDQVAFIELTNQFTASLRAEFAHLGSDACASFSADSVSIP